MFEKPNMYMTQIVNRAVSFDKKKHNIICVDLKDNNEDFVIYKTILILHYFTKNEVTFYAPFSSFFVHFREKGNKCIKYVPRFIYNKLKNKPKTFVWINNHTPQIVPNEIRVLTDFTQDQIAEIVKMYKENPEC